MVRRIVVGYDGTGVARAAVDRAIALTREGHDWEIVLVCTHERPADFTHQSVLLRPRLIADVPPEVWLSEWDARVTAEMEHAALRVRMDGVDSSAVCSRDDPAELIVRTAHDVKARYVVMADDRSGALHDLVLGSLTRRVLHLCDVPVVLVPAEDEARRSA